MNLNKVVPDRGQPTIIGIGCSRHTFKQSSLTLGCTRTTPRSSVTESSNAHLRTVSMRIETADSPNLNALPGHRMLALSLTDSASALSVALVRGKRAGQVSTSNVD